jgi:nucleoid DNA-binding protein
MATSVKLYAWAVPGFIARSPVDHTWVTTYDNRTNALADIQQVVAAKEFFWYCWGDFHPKGGTPTLGTGFLGEQEGDVALAQCLVQPNAVSLRVIPARGTIFRYARDGVCHQLANQVLYATGINGAQPLTVERARGYMFSSFRYGTYGLNEAAWKEKYDSCGSPRRRLRRGPGGSQMTRKPDDFETRAREVLGRQDRELLSKLRALRTKAQRLSNSQWTRSYSPSAEGLNASNQEMFDRAADLLGPDKFEKIFGFAPYEKVDLIDPRMLKEQEPAVLPLPTIWPAAAGRSMPTAPSTVTLKHLAATIAADNELSRKQAEAFLGEFVGQLVKHLKKGERVRLGALGVLQVRKSAARVGRNPSTGEAIQIKASKKVAFRASKELKEAI